PWLVRRHEKAIAEGENRQTPDELDAYKPWSMCINCMLCYSACPIYGLEPSFIGPAAIALAQRYNQDSRDQGAAERLEILSGHDGLWQCTFVGECSKVCPKNVDPAGRSRSTGWPRDRRPTSGSWPAWARPSCCP